MKVTSNVKPKRIEIKDIPGYEGLYAITKNGRVWSYPKEWISGSNFSVHRHYGQWLKESMVINQGPSLNLSKNNIKKSYKVCNLVAMTYLPKPGNKKHIFHINKDIYDNSYINLIWSKSRIGKDNKRVKKIIQYTKGHVYIRSYASIRGAERALKIFRGHICKCAKGRLLSAGGFIWEYAE